MRLRAPAVSALKPPTGLSAVIFCPIVRTILQPPESVPRPIAVCAVSTTQNGISKVLRYPDVTRTPAMIPMVFCASLVPCPRLNSAAEISCNRRKYLSTLDGALPRKIHCSIVMKKRPSTIPITGERTMNNNVFVQPAGMITCQPALTTALPA